MRLQHLEEEFIPGMGCRSERRLAIGQIHVFDEALDGVRAFWPCGPGVERRENFRGEVTNRRRGPELIAIRRQPL
jgi:hypothetical protein